MTTTATFTTSRRDDLAMQALGIALEYGRSDLNVYAIADRFVEVERENGRGEFAPEDARVVLGGIVAEHMGF